MTVAQRAAVVARLLLFEPCCTSFACSQGAEFHAQVAHDLPVPARLVTGQENVAERLRTERILLFRLVVSVADAAHTSLSNQFQFVSEHLRQRGHDALAHLDLAGEASDHAVPADAQEGVEVRGSLLAEAAAPLWILRTK